MKGLVIGLCLLSLVLFCSCSSHSEAPGTSKKAIADITDVFFFRSYESGRQDFVTLIVNVQGLQLPNAGPNYYSLSEEIIYEINIDNDGDGNEDITYQIYSGNALGGEIGEVEYDLCTDNTNDCLESSSKKRNFGAPALTALKHRGLTLKIGDKDIPVALKFIGSITATDESAVNWFEWYYVNQVTGGRDSGNVNKVTNADNGSDKFYIPFDYAGEKTFPDYETYANQFIYDISIPSCPTNGRIFIGQRAEPFVINIGPVFDLINFIPIPGFPGAIEQSDANNQLSGLNIDSIIMELPISCVKSSKTDVIGVWAATRELHHVGEDHVAGKQVSRLANPLVNELFTGIIDKYRYNLLHPLQDFDYKLDDYIKYPTFSEILNILFLDAVNTVLEANLPTIAPTNIPREDLYALFYTGVAGINQPPKVKDSEMMRLNVTIPPTAFGSQNQFGVFGGDLAGYPNGRRPGDDVIDISLQAVMGRFCSLSLYCVPTDANVGNVDLTDGAPINDGYFKSGYPYLNIPHTASFTSRK